MTRRVPAFSSPEQLQAGIDAYFARCDEDKSRPNHVGLANHLGVPLRTLRDYNRRPAYGEILEMAKQCIEGDRIQMLFDKTVPTAGVIFDLVNNFGWHNTQRSEHSGPKGGPIAVTSTPMPADVQNEIDAHKEELAASAQS